MRYVVDIPAGEEKPVKQIRLIQCGECMFYSRYIKTVCGLHQCTKSPDDYCSWAVEKNRAAAGIETL